MHVAQHWTGGKFLRPLRPAASHVSAVSDQQHTCFDREDFVVAHVANDDLVDEGADESLLAKRAGVSALEVSQDEVAPEVKGVPFVAVARHGHSDIVNESGERDGELRVVISAGFLANERHLPTQVRALDHVHASVERDGKTIVIRAQSL